MIELPIKSSNKEMGLLFILILIGITGGVFSFTPSYFSNLNVLIGLCLFPFTLLITGPKRNNFLYIGAIIVFSALAFKYNIRICYFFSLAFYFLWLIELFAGRLNVLILFLILLMSPFFVHVVTILGFPLRLALSEYAGALLNLAGTNVQVEGNVMILDGEAFNVDEACMGLNMLVISMMMTVFILVYHYRLSKKAFGLCSLTFFFVITFILNMITNLLRIMILVFFRIPPEDPMHDFIGILCLIVYVIVPLHFLSEWLIKRYGKSKINSATEPIHGHSKSVFIAILPVIILSVGPTLEKNQYSGVGHADIHFNNIEPQRLNDGISKISTDDLLIYVKIIPEFFTGEHTPLMCWKGSGYQFSGVGTITVEGIDIYKGTLLKEGSLLYTAWWYSNGQFETISQLDWRMRMLLGEPNFCLVNVTAEDEDLLMTSVKSMLTTDELEIKVE